MGSPILFWRQFKLQPFWIINSRSIWPTLQVLNIVCVHVDHPSIEQQWEIVSEGKVRMQVKVSDNKTELNSIVPQPVSRGDNFVRLFSVCFASLSTTSPQFFPTIIDEASHILVGLPHHSTDLI